MFGFGRLLLLIFAECMGLLTRGIPIAPIATTRNSSMHIKQYDYGRKTKKNIAQEFASLTVLWGNAAE